MADSFPLQVSAALARKGHDLAAQREAYYRELLESGRWHHYGTQADVQKKLTETEAELKRWRAMLDHPAENTPAPAEERDDTG